MGVCASKTERVQDILAESVFYNMIPEEIFQDFSKCFVRAEYEAGPIFNAGDAAELYVITESEAVSVAIDITIDGKQSSIVCAKDEVGDIIGMLNTTGNCKQAVAAEAKMACVLLRLDYQQYKVFSQAHPEAAAVLGPVTGQIGAALAQIPFFRGISEEQFTLIGNLLKPVSLGPDQALFHEGDNGQSMYIVISGTCKAVVNVRPETEVKEGEEKTEAKQEKVLATFRSNDLLGEIALGLAIPRTASIITTEPSLFLELTADMFHDFKAIVKSSAVHIEKLVKRRTAEHFRRYKVPFFEAIPESKYAALAAECEINQHLEGATIFKQGDAGDKFYMVTFGELKVSIDQEDGPPKELPFRLGPGKYFGEIALVQDTTRTATISAVSRCILLSLNRKNFDRFFAESPEAIADFEIKLAKMNSQLRSILYHPLGLDVFTKFCESEYSDENIKFWKLCHQYKHTDYKQYDDAARAAYLTETEEKFDDDKITTNLGELGMMISNGAAAEEAFDIAMVCLAAATGTTPITCNDLGCNNPSDPAVVTEALKQSDSPAARIIRGSGSTLEWDIVRDKFETWAHTSPGFLDVDEWEPAVQAVDPFPSSEHINANYERLCAGNSGVDLHRFTTYCLELQLNKKLLQKSLEEQAQRLWDQFVSPSAEEQVNVSQVYRDVVRRAITERCIDIHSYDDTMAEIYTMMNRDSFTRFKDTEQFQKFLKEIDSYS